MLKSEEAKRDRFLVCGLGSLGQHCVAALKEFGVNVVAIEQISSQSWEIPQMSDLLDDLIIADCRQNSILAQAKIEQCRAALIVTANEQVNIETALAIRQLNPHTRLVVRSAKENLNSLLSEQLGNFIAYEPTQLTADAFALAALGTQTRGFFTLDGQRLRVIALPMQPDDRWCNVRRLHELNTRTRRVLTYTDGSDRALQSFYQWEPNALLQAGDTVTFIELADTLLALPDVSSVRSQAVSWPQSLRGRMKGIERSLTHFWQLSFQQQVRRVALACGFIVLFLLIIGTILLRWTHPETTLLSAFSATAILLLGGYSDLFGEFEQIADIPAWLQLFSLGLTLAGTAFVGVLYALLTESLLSAKFQFVKNRPSVPTANHAIIIGMGRVGQRVAALLQEFKQPSVGVTMKLDFDPTILPNLPLIAGNLGESLDKANLATAKSVVVVTDEEILNLEVALMAQKLNPNSHLVIRTAGMRLADHLLQILPNAQAVGAYAVAAEVFAAAAFGENILSLLRLNNQTILVTEYQIEADDTLDGLLLSEVACGYGVVPILQQRPPHPSQFMPSEDIQLTQGDRLVVLATIEGLRRVEQGRLGITPKTWRIRVDAVLNADAAFEGANAITRVTGCSLKTARLLMSDLPATLSVPLYQHQGLRLVLELGKLRVTAKLVPI